MNLKAEKLTDLNETSKAEMNTAELTPSVMSLLPDACEIAQRINALSPDDTHQSLCDLMKELSSSIDLSLVLSRGGWHREGGIVDVDGERIAEDVESWLAQYSVSNIETFIDEFIDKEYQVTVLRGQTLYFSASYATQASDAIQVEVEVLTEVTDHPLLLESELPDQVEDLLEPITHHVQEKPKQIGQAKYAFRRSLDINQLLEQLVDQERKHTASYTRPSMLRFMQDWDASSAAKHSHFTKNWIFAVRSIRDQYGADMLSVKPVPTFKIDSDPFLENPPSSEIERASLVRGIDHKTGVPFLWFFQIIFHGWRTGHSLIEAIAQDHQNGYDYLPACDLEILFAWLDRPYRP